MLFKVPARQYDQLCQCLPRNGRFPTRMKQMRDDRVCPSEQTVGIKDAKAGKEQSGTRSTLMPPPLSFSMIR